MVTTEISTSFPDFGSLHSLKIFVPFPFFYLRGDLGCCPLCRMTFGLKTGDSGHSLEVGCRDMLLFTHNKCGGWDTIKQYRSYLLIVSYSGRNFFFYMKFLSGGGIRVWGWVKYSISGTGPVWEKGTLTVEGKNVRLLGKKVVYCS